VLPQELLRAAEDEVDSDDESEDNDEDDDYYEDDDDSVPELDDVPELSPEMLKEEGNAHFKSKNYAGAIDAYGRAIELALSLGLEVPSYYLNRAAAYMNKLM